MHRHCTEVHYTVRKTYLRRTQVNFIKPGAHPERVNGDRGWNANGEIGKDFGFRDNV